MDILMVKGASSDAAREVIVDMRAGGFRTGSSTVGAYLTYLQKEGVNLKMVVVGSWQKRHFRSGDGKVLQCNQCVLLPVFVQGRRGELLAFMIPWRALKPTTEQLELVLDFQKGVARWGRCSRGQITNTS